MKLPIKTIAAFFKILVLLIVLLAWPISSLSDHALGIGLEKTPAFGWIIDYGGFSDFPGFGFGLYDGDFFVLSRRLIPHSDPPPRLGGYLTELDIDGTYWMGSLPHGIGVGSYSCGYVTDRNWTERTGILFPTWLLSSVAGLILIWKICGSLRRRTSSNVSRCPTCSHDLRAHAPGANCPECGTLIPSAAATRLQ
jgi:hypothetical protein